MDAVTSARGAFILLEGVDRCGKTTQARLLADYCLQKTGAAEFIRFPDRDTTIGRLIDSYLKSASNLNDQSIHLLFSANRWEKADFIEEKLAAGTTLVCDRYAYSGVAFTSAKGLDLEWCRSCDRGLPSPDCVIYLDLPVEDAAQRGAFGEERYEKVEFQQQVRSRFMQLKEADDGSAVPWFVVDARQSIADVHDQLRVLADRVIEQRAARQDDKLKLWVA